jgi:hypothetical protein
MNSARALCAGSMVVLFLIAGCGSGSDGFDPNKVTVTVSPAAVTIPAGDAVTLQATVKGLCSTCISLINEWKITENGGSPNCTWFDTPPLGPCPGGTIQEVTGGNSLTATYHSPSTSGTFHVVAEWCICFGSSITKDGTSVVTVSP